MPRRAARCQHDLPQHGSYSAAWRGGGVSSFPESGSEAGLTARARASRAPFRVVQDVCERRGGRVRGVGRKEARVVGVLGGWAWEVFLWRGGGRGDRRSGEVRRLG
eukprot:305702-Pleurochrysis_carterae.AAC.1